MPYSRKSYKTFRPRTFNRRNRRRLPNVGQTKFFTPRNMYSAARYAAKGVNILKTIINSETKRFDTILSVTPSSTAAFNLLTAIDQGDDINNRNGNSILGKYIKFNWTLNMNASASATQFRMILFADNDDDQVTPTSNSLLANNAVFTSATNPDFLTRYTILYDRIFQMSINGDRMAMDKFYKTLQFHIKYATATGSTGYGKNSLWLYTQSNEATNTPTLTFYSRLAYYDN